MAEFGQRQYGTARITPGTQTPGLTKCVVGLAIVIAVIAGLFLGHRSFYHSAKRDPLLEKHESVLEMVNRHASDEELFREYPSLDTRPIPIAFGNKTYKIPRNYLVDLDRPDVDPTKNTTFEIHVLLPDLVPRSANNADKFLKPPHFGGHGDQMNATIRGWQKELDLSARQVEWTRWCADNGAGVFSPVESGYRLCETATHELYLKDTTEGPLLFACDKIASKTLGCTIAEPTGAQWGVLTLDFSRKYLYQADEIRRRFRSLLDSFADK
ncbi:hypothetical protein LQG66_35215 [Bradyrhizobium ontarionense]|uniref:Uncharacterized protein n=1 Tax=Bradyrhizobium ontarionense TaxID=2898149 RepID=A0ABY3RBG1_9BRAD|nr:hypothetical protein [Bradyrhizobium sp. A19]UFZ04377.1 hypothetical protein LQG66_35215 [Bradyrhizobium sp. A19]